MSRTTPNRFAAMLAVLLVSLLALPQPAAAAADPTKDRLPDLGMLTPQGFYVQTLGDGTRRLRFDAYIYNRGAGYFELALRRSSGDSTMEVRQKIRNTADPRGYRTVLTSAIGRYSGDGHAHWHTDRVARYTLLRWDPSIARYRAYREGAKVGFCFFDTNVYDRTLAGAPASGVYGEAGCGDAADLTARMGLSIGWSDKYPAGIAYQWIDVTGRNGEYRVCLTVDRNKWFLESDERNNQAWADVRFASTGSGVTVLRSGRSSCSTRA